MGDDRAARPVAAVVARAVPGAAVMKHGGARRHFDRDDLVVADAGGGRRPLQICQGIVGRMELRDRRRDRPAMRTAHIFDRALMGLRVVERHPAGQHLAGHDPFVVAVVLVKSQRLGSRRLPDDVVLADARAGPAAQARGGFADVGPQHEGGDGEVGLPGIADLPGQVLRGRGRAASSTRRDRGRFRTRPRTAARSGRAPRRRRPHRATFSTTTKPSRSKVSRWACGELDHETGSITAGRPASATAGEGEHDADPAPPAQCARGRSARRGRMLITPALEAVTTASSG